MSEENDADDNARNQSKRLRDAISNSARPKMPGYDNASKLEYNVARDKETGEIENIVDYENLENVNETINSARVSLFKISKAMDDTERKLKVMKTEYDREFRREYLQSTEKTETRKKEFAALMTEQIEDKVLYLEQVKTELNRRATLLRDELSIMNTLSNNIRQQIRGS